MIGQLFAIRQVTTRSHAIIEAHLGAVELSSHLEQEQVFPHAHWFTNNQEEVCENAHKAIDEILPQGNITRHRIDPIDSVSKSNFTFTWGSNTSGSEHNRLARHGTRTKPTPKGLTSGDGPGRLKSPVELPLTPYCVGTL